MFMLKMRISCSVSSSVRFEFNQLPGIFLQAAIVRVLCPQLLPSLKFSVLLPASLGMSLNTPISRVKCVAHCNAWLPHKQLIFRRVAVPVVKTCNAGPPRYRSEVGQCINHRTLTSRDDSTCVCINMHAHE